MTGVIVFIIIIVVLSMLQQHHIREMGREEKLEERHRELMQQQKDLAAEVQEREDQREYDRTHPMSVEEEFAMDNYKDEKYTESVGQDDESVVEFTNMKTPIFLISTEGKDIDQIVDEATAAARRAGILKSPENSGVEEVAEKNNHIPSAGSVDIGQASIDALNRHTLH